MTIQIGHDTYMLFWGKEKNRVLTTAHQYKKAKKHFLQVKKLRNKQPKQVTPVGIIGDTNSRTSKSIEISAKLLHKRMGHANYLAVEHTIRQASFGMRVANNVLTRIGKTCVLIGQCKISTNGSLVKISHGVTRHINICGPILAIRLREKYHFLTVTTTAHPHTETEVLSNGSTEIGHCTDYNAWFERSSKHIAIKLH